jgi:hypothetical protein
MIDSLFGGTIVVTLRQCSISFKGVNDSESVNDCREQIGQLSLVGRPLSLKKPFGFCNQFSEQKCL